MWHIRGEEKSLQGLMRKLVGIGQRGRSGSRWEGNIKRVVKEILLESVN